MAATGRGRRRAHGARLIEAAAVSLLIGGPSAGALPHAPAPQSSETNDTIKTADNPAESPPEQPSFARLTLGDAPQLEGQILDGLMDSAHWAPRALAAARLERFNCEESRRELENLLTDRAWQVRAYAIRSLARRGQPAAEHWFAEEHHPRVIRAIVRHGYELDADRLGRGVRALARSANLDDMMLAAEIGASAADPDLQQLAEDTARTVALRMNRVQAGVLSPRLATLTDGFDRRNRYEWQRYIHETGRRFELKPWRGAPGDGIAMEPSLLARIETERFAQLERYVRELGQRQLDLVVVLDATGSMSGVFHRSLGCVDDLLLLGRDMTSSFRAGLVAYRDQRQEFETRAWGFDAPLDEVRHHMWIQEAYEGGTSTESVLAALKVGYAQMSWLPSSEKAVLLIGDGAPHVGEGALCIEFARRAWDQLGIATHVVQPRGEDIKHFRDIAEAGGGQCADLKTFIPLIRDVLGLAGGEALDEEFREFLLIYFQLCR